MDKPHSSHKSLTSIKISCTFHRGSDEHWLHMKIKINQSASLWEQPVPLSWQIFSYVNIGMNLFKDKTQKLKLSISTYGIFMMFCELITHIVLVFLLFLFGFYSLSCGTCVASFHGLSILCYHFSMHALFTSILSVCAQWCPTYVVLCFCVVFFSSCFLDCHFWIALWYSLTFGYRRRTFFPNCIWTPTFSAKHNNLASVVCHTSLTLFHFNTVTTNFNGEGGYVSLQIFEYRSLSFCHFIVLLLVVLLSVLLRFADCNYPLIYFSCCICMIFFACKT